MDSIAHDNDGLSEQANGESMPNVTPKRQVSRIKARSVADLSRKHATSDIVDCSYQSKAFSNAAGQLKKLLQPNAKKSAEEFKCLFELPTYESYMIGYYCAYLKDILVQGKLFVSQNYLCFYSNILSWETKLVVPFRDVKSILKKRTAKIIPNAIQIIKQNGEKFFFTSFSSRDKAFLTIFKLWQYSIRNKCATIQELWTWSHYGLTDGQEDDVDSTQSDASDGLMSTNSSKAVPLVYVHKASVGDKMDNVSNSLSELAKEKKKRKRNLWTMKKKSVSLLDLPSMEPESASKKENSATSLYDTSEDDDGQLTGSCECSEHRGKEMLNATFDVSVEQMFQFLFTNSDFYRRLHSSRKSTDLVVHEWSQNLNTGTKTRQVSYTASLEHQSLGPKSCGVVENQICEPTNDNNRMYIVKAYCRQIGIPYADTFETFAHYCITKVNSDCCRLRVHAGVTYTKKCWALVKNFIDKNAISGIAEYFEHLGTQLNSECSLNDLTSNFAHQQTVVEKKVQKKIDVSNVRQSLGNA